MEAVEALLLDNRPPPHFAALDVRQYELEFVANASLMRQDGPKRAAKVLSDCA